MPDLTPLTPSLQQKAQQLREQARQAQSAPGFDGVDIVHIIDGVVQLLNGPAPDFAKISEQLPGLAENLKDAVPDNLDFDAGEIIQPLLEGIGDLLGSLGDFSS
jgi:hypothetical protein